MALTSMLRKNDRFDAVVYAVEAADLLIEELNKEQK